MGRRSQPRVEIAGPAAGTVRAGRKANSAIIERVKVGSVEVTIRYPGLFSEEQIEAARLTTWPAAVLAERIRDRMMTERRTWKGATTETGHVTSGKMWQSMSVRVLRDRVRVSFRGSSQSYDWHGHIEYPAEYTGPTGKWSKRDRVGKYAKAAEGEVRWVRDYPPKFEPTGKSVPNRLKAQKSSESDKTSILGYTESERTDFARAVGETLEAVVSDMV